MSSTLLVHPTSLALTTLPRVGSAPTPLQFPTRFPSGASPRTAMSPNGHTYLWADSLPVVWEYDSRGRRVGEIKLGSRERIAAVGCGDGVVIASSGSAGVWRRVEGKWTRMGELEVSVAKREVRHQEPGVLTPGAEKRHGGRVLRRNRRTCRRPTLCIRGRQAPPTAGRTEGKSPPLLR